MATLILDASELLTMRGPEGPRRGRDRDALGLLRDGAVLVENGLIVDCGPRAKVLAHPRAKSADTLSAGGRVVLPGFVDSHTHPVFAAPRLDDFTARVKGLGYAEIARAGGGIMSTVIGVRQSSEAELTAGLRRRAFDFLATGTTTIEAKSGYGLDLDNELKILRALSAAARRGPLEIISTFLGAHAVPDELAGRKDEYLERVCAEMIPRVAREKLAAFVDLFCESGYFDLADLERVASAGASAGLGLKVHAEQLTRLGSLAPALRRGAVSVDHLDCASEADLPGLAGSGTVACLVPGSNYFLGKPYPPARALLDAGAAVALATDFNPGTCPCSDMRMMLSIACTQLRMSPAEALVAATINGASAVNLNKSHGSLELGKVADLACFEAEDHRELAYWFGGAPRLRWTMKRGELVHGAP